MQTPTIRNSNGQLFIASDLHITSDQDLRGQRFLQLLKIIEKSSAEALVLVGDVFDFILGSNRFYRRKFTAFGEGLERVAQSGTRVIFIEGNHEYDLKKLDWQGVEFVDERDFILTLKQGTKLAFTHGDQVYAPKAYQHFRKVVKSRWFLNSVRFIPGPLMDWLALRGSHASRSQDQYRTIDHGAILSAMEKWLPKDVDYGVFGHFHVPYADPSQSSKGLLLSCDSWDSPSVLVYNQDGFSRWQYENSELDPTLPQGLTPVFRAST